ncbi:hypothetical protein B0J17DRAFT_42504 [Rhizoctonia solani]|nr:hypothetical protein B0J17DRAFT_42504 [Rhizoctonia solani]
MKGCWKCVDRPPRTDESRLLCDRCALSSGELGSTDLATFGSYRLDTSSTVSVPSFSPWAEHTSESHVRPFREGSNSTTATCAMFTSDSHQATTPEGYPGQISPEDWTYWPAQNDTHREKPNCISKEFFIPVDNYSVMEGLGDFSMTVFGEAGLNPFDDQAISLEDHSGQFLDSPWQIRPLGILSVPPVCQHASDARGNFEIPGTPYPNLQPERHNINSGRAAPSMSSGQRSIYQALLSLEYTSDESTTNSSTTHDSSTGSPIPTQSWPNTTDIVEPADREDDPDGVMLALCGVLSIDPGVESNSLPFVLQCCEFLTLSFNWIMLQMTLRCELDEENDVRSFADT